VAIKLVLLILKIQNKNIAMSVIKIIFLLLNLYMAFIMIINAVINNDISILNNYE